MANVLNKVTRQYLLSVNTPEYSEEDWIINPDLSEVSGLAPHYWVVEGESVRSMTPAEMAVYDAANPAQPAAVSRLADGTPAYMYQGKAISINTQTVEYRQRTIGSKNFYVPTIAGSTGAKVVKNSVIKSLRVEADSGGFDLVLAADGRMLHTIHCLVGGVYEDVYLEVAAGESITCFVASAENVTNPSVTLHIAQR